MIQLPLFDAASLTTRTDAAARLQALVDALLPAQGMTELVVIRRRDGWYLHGEARYFGDDGLDYLGRDVQEAEAAIRQMARYHTRGE